MRRFARGLLLALLLLGVAVYPVYLAAGNAFLRPDTFDRLVNRRPQSLLIRFRSARTVWPGVVEVEGFEIRGQTRTVQWWAAVDRGRVSFDLPALAGRRFLARAIEGEGVSFRLARRTDAPPRWPVDPALRPPIPGLANPPDPAPEDLYPRRKRRRDPWQVALKDVKLAGVREIWIEEHRFAGQARAAGGFDLVPRRSLTVLPSRLEVTGGDLLRGDRPALARVRGKVEARFERFDPRRYRGREALRFALGRVDLAGEVAGFDFLEPFLQRARWIEVQGGGGGPVAADLRLARGRFLPGSRLTAQPRELRVAFLDYEARGSGSLAWSVEAGVGAKGAKGGSRCRLGVALDRFEVQRRGYRRPHVVGRGLELVVLSDGPRLGRLFAPASVTIEMPSAEVPDLTFYNAYLPVRSGLTIRSGTGRMSGRFRAAAPAWTGSGEMALRGEGVMADFRDSRLRGDLALDTRIRQVDLKRRDFDISGSRFELTGVTLLGGELDGPPPGWWARAHLDRARLRPGRPVFLTASVEATMRDAGPVLALFAPRKRIVQRLERVLAVQGVGATADLTLGPDSVELDRLAVAGGKALLRARLRIAERPRGILYARYGRFALGLELDGAERDWKVQRPQRWFESHPGW